MARINIETEFFCDPRFISLCTKMPRWEAIGAVISLWELGQAYWKKDGSLIPEELFCKLHRWQDLCDVGFAKRRVDAALVYCTGAREKWAFLLWRMEAGRKGGLHSAASRKAKYGTEIPIGASNLDPDIEAKTEAKPKQTEANRSNSEAKSSIPNPSSSSSSSPSEEELIHIAQTPDPNAPQQEPAPKKPKSSHSLRSLLEKIYEKNYPRKRSKTKGLNFLERDVKPDEVTVLETAMKNYAADSADKEAQFIKHFSTWAREWRDWIEVSDDTSFPTRQLTDEEREYLCSTIK